MSRKGTMDKSRVLSQIDSTKCLDFLAAMIRYKSYSGTPGESELARFMVDNMKAGDAAYFCALRTLVENGVRLGGDVILTFVVGELQGGVGTVKMIESGLR